MTSDAPGPGQPGSGLPPEPDAQAPSTGEWPAELVPPPAAPEAPAPAPAAPEPPGGAPAPTPATTSGTWGAPAAPASDSAGASSGTWGTTQSSGTWGSPPAAQPAAPPPDAAAPAAPPVPQTPPATTTWGQPAAPATPPAAAPAPAPAEAGWGQPATPAAPAPAQPQAWGAAATPPPADGGWGAPPVTPGQPGAAGGPGAWGAPPAQPGGWAPGRGVPGAPPPGSWAPAPAKSGNGCLKACLIVGVILVVIGIIGSIGLAMLGSAIVGDVVGPDGQLAECQYISDAELDAAIGRDGDALPSTGLIGELIEGMLDNRILSEAPGCWITADELAGKIAVQDGNGAATFAATKADGVGEYVGPDVPGFGDEAFCTGMASAAGSGMLVRSGDRLVFVSLADPNLFQDLQVTDDGVLYSPSACELAGRIAEAVLR